MQINKKYQHKKKPRTISSTTKNCMDEFGRKIWRVIAKWSGDTGETEAKSVLAKKLNMTERTFQARFYNHMSWSVWELKVIRDTIGSEEIRSIVNDYIG